MPVVEIKLLEGRSNEMREELIQSVSNSVADSLEVPLSEVTVILDEMDKQNYAKAGVSRLKSEAEG